MEGLSNNEYINIIEMPVTKQEKYLYQILMSVNELIDIVKVYNKDEIVDERKSKRKNKSNKVKSLEV